MRQEAEITKTEIYLSAAQLGNPALREQMSVRSRHLPQRHGGHLCRDGYQHICRFFFYLTEMNSRLYQFSFHLHKNLAFLPMQPKFIYFFFRVTGYSTTHSYLILDRREGRGHV